MQTRISENKEWWGEINWHSTVIPMELRAKLQSLLESLKQNPWNTYTVAGNTFYTTFTIPTDFFTKNWLIPDSRIDWSGRHPTVWITWNKDDKKVIV